jgi:plasmid stability protein
MLAFCYLHLETTMPQVLIRELDPATVKRLKERARQHNRSLQGEAKAILEQAVAIYTMGEACTAARRVRQRTARTNKSDSVDLLRESRER